jgi:hypothetical protein
MEKQRANLEGDAMTSTEKLKKYPELYRAEISCKIGRDVLEGITKSPEGVSPVDWALFNILHSIGDIAAAMMKQQEQETKYCQCRKLWPSPFCPECGKLANATRKQAEERAGQ